MAAGHEAAALREGEWVRGRWVETAAGTVLETMARKLAVSIPRIALTPAEAAAAIGVGPDFFEENVAPELRVVRRGRKRLVPIIELERWMAENAERALGE